MHSTIEKIENEAEGREVIKITVQENFVQTDELIAALCPPATLHAYPSFRGDHLLVSGLLLSSAFCQVKNTAFEGCLCPVVRLQHYSIKLYS